MKPDPAWSLLETHQTFTLYEVDEGLLVVWPAENCVDNEESATESVNAQHNHWRAKGRSGGSVIMMDLVQEQTNEARKVYQTLPDPELVTSFALVGGTIFGRAVSSVFLGILRPQVPTRAFADFNSAADWVHQRNARPN